MYKGARFAYVFPGQGSQTLGMGYRLFNEFTVARGIFNQADKALGISISKLCFEGPEEDLVKTINVQPAILTVSIACLAVAKEISGNAIPAPCIMAGHSLGEYTALVAAGALEFGDALKLVRERGRLMYEAGQKMPGGMAAVIGLDEVKVAEICMVSGTEISNVNSPGQIVISGSLENMQAAINLFKAQAGARLVPLKVSGAFHSKLMKTAAEGMTPLINRTGFKVPTVSVVANMSSEMLSDSGSIKSELIGQIVNCVKWQKSVEVMIAAGVDSFIEFGSGQVLSNLIKRINPVVKTYTVNDGNITEQVNTLIKNTSGTETRLDNSS